MSEKNLSKKVAFLEKDETIQKSLKQKTKSSRFKKSYSASLMEKDLLQHKDDNFVNSPFYMKFGKNKLLSTEFINATHQQSNNTSSDEEFTEEGKLKHKEKLLRKEFDLSMKNIQRSKSNAIKRNNEITVVKEQKEDEENIYSKDKEKLKFFNEKILLEGYDKAEEATIHPNSSRIISSCKTSICYMDPVIEEDKEENAILKEDIKPFGKLKFIHDSKEDKDIGIKNQHALGFFELEDVINEDNKENDIEYEEKKTKYNTHNLHLIKYEDIIDKSEINLAEPVIHINKNFVTEEIKEEEDNPQEEIVYNPKSKRQLF